MCLQDCERRRIAKLFRHRSEESKYIAGQATEQTMHFVLHNQLVHFIIVLYLATLTQVASRRYLLQRCYIARCLQKLMLYITILHEDILGNVYFSQQGLDRAKVTCLHQNFQLHDYSINSIFHSLPLFEGMEEAPQSHHTIAVWFISHFFYFHLVL